MLKICRDCRNLPCAWCRKADRGECQVDLSMPCSPYCENLTEDGHILVKKCIESGCDAVNSVFDEFDNDKLIEEYGDVAVFPYDV